LEKLREAEQGVSVTVFSVLTAALIVFLHHIKGGLFGFPVRVDEALAVEPFLIAVEPAGGAEVV
jgi:hypothetical protein